MFLRLQTYSLEQKAQAVSMVAEEGLGIKETAKRLAIPNGTVAGWAMPSCLLKQE